MIIAVFLIVISIGFAQSAQADENFRVPRPAATVSTPVSSAISSGASGAASNALLGDVIYAGMRTPMPRASFERWRQNYCSPFICNMVLCHGTCADFAEHCPSFSESGRVIHLDTPGCMMPSNQISERVLQGNHCAAEH